MTSLRIRRYGTDDWTIIRIDGDGDLADLLAGDLSQRGYHVQICSDDGWEDWE
jgi:hypothetical protein